MAAATDTSTLSSTELLQHSTRKAAKEAFVAGLTGSSQLEVFALALTLPLAIVICEHVKQGRAAVERLALEMLLLIYLHLLLATEALPLWPTFIGCLVTAAICIGRTVVRPDLQQAKQPLPLDDLAGKRKSFLSVSRGAFMAATCICILAVDFRTFPRRYAKTEMYGTGYMDVGVGGIVLAAGSVSPAALTAAFPTTRQGLRDSSGRSAGPSEPLWRRACAGLRAAAACWVMALARLLTLRAVDYQSHVGEYGVHWNFFATIAVVALLGRLLPPPPHALLPAAVAVTAAHQMALTLGGLGPWVMSQDRGSDLLSLNKEGLVSCVGFWALYLWGAALAYHAHLAIQTAVQHIRRTTAPSPPSLLGPQQQRRQQQQQERPALAARVAAVKPILGCALHVAAFDGVLWLALAILEARVEPVSRRSCNAAYIVWVAAQWVAWVLPLALSQAVATAVSAVTANPHEPAPYGAAGGGAGCMRAGASGGGGGGGGGGSAQEPLSDAGMGARAPKAAVEEVRNSGKGALVEGKRRADVAPSSGGGLAVGAAGAAADCAAGVEKVVAAPYVERWGPEVLQAINRNQLAVFLVANLLTGAVNLSVDTLQLPHWPARALLGAYITCVCAVAVLLDARSWRLKL